MKSRILLLTVALLAFSGALRAEFHVMDAWARETPPGTDVGAVYFRLHNAGAEAVTLTAVDTTVAGRAEFHETVVQGGVASMRHRHHIEVASDTQLDFEPGGHHVMLMGLEQPIVAGDVFSLELKLDTGATVSVEVTVQPVGYQASSGQDHMSHEHSPME